MYPQGGYGRGYPPQQGGYPPQSGYGGPPPYGGYPPQQGGYPPQSGYGGPPQSMPQQQQGIQPPPTSFNNQWYGRYYTQMSPQELYEIQAWFRSIDTDRSGSITANEIANITFNNAPLGWDVAFRLVNVFDKDRNGSIDFYEYAAMHKFLSTLQTAFFAGDRDRSGRLDAREIHTALGTAGLTVPMNAVQSMMKKHDKSGYGVIFHDFLLMCATIAQGRSLFQWRDPGNSGRITLTLDQLLELVGQMS